MSNTTPISKKRNQSEAEGKVNKNSTHSPVPVFLANLYSMLDDTKLSSIISWNDTGTAFIVKNVTGFTEIILPRFFKHKNFASFVRQLNMYNFSKIKELGWEHCYSHKMFKRGKKILLKEIHRKSANSAKKKFIQDETPKQPWITGFRDTIQYLAERIKRLEYRSEEYERLQDEYDLLNERNHLLEWQLGAVFKLLQKKLLKTKDLEDPPQAFFRTLSRGMAKALPAESLSSLSSFHVAPCLIQKSLPFPSSASVEFPEENLSSSQYKGQYSLNGEEQGSMPLPLAPCEIQEDYSLESLDIQSSSQESLKSSSGYFQALDLSASLPEENSSSFEVEPMDFPYGPQVKLKIARPEKDLQY